MSARDLYRPVFEALLKASHDMQAAHGFIVQASEAQQRAGGHMTDAFTALVDTRDEHEDLRETVTRLEGLVLDLTTEVRHLRDERRS